MRTAGTAGLRDRGTAEAAHDRSERRLGSLVGEITARLEAAGVRDAPREARDLVAALADKPRFWTSLEPDAPVTAVFTLSAHAAAERRARGAPFAYAVGRAAFRYLTLRVDERVLIPRQETELLVEL